MKNVGLGLVVVFVFSALAQAANDSACQSAARATAANAIKNTDGWKSYITDQKITPVILSIHVVKATAATYKVTVSYGESKDPQFGEHVATHDFVVTVKRLKDKTCKTVSVADTDKTAPTSSIQRIVEAAYKKLMKDNLAFNNFRGATVKESDLPQTAQKEFEHLKKIGAGYKPGSTKITAGGVETYAVYLSEGEGYYLSVYSMDGFLICSGSASESEDWRWD